MTSIFEGQPPKTRPFPIKTRVIWVPGIYPPTPWSPEAKGKARGEAVHVRDTKVRHELSPEVQANRGRSCHSCTVNFFFIWVPFRMRCRGSGEAHRGVSPFWTRCRGRGKSVCIGFERWMKHTSRGSGPSVFNGFEGRVRHTLASHSGPFWATSWA